MSDIALQKKILELKARALYEHLRPGLIALNSQLETLQKHKSYLPATSAEHTALAAKIEELENEKHKLEKLIADFEAEIRKGVPEEVPPKPDPVPPVDPNKPKPIDPNPPIPGDGKSGAGNKNHNENNAGGGGGAYAEGGNVSRSGNSHVSITLPPPIVAKPEDLTPLVSQFEEIFEEFSSTLDTIK